MLSETLLIAELSCAMGELVASVTAGITATGAAFWVVLPLI
jgi:hypothetical protein